MNLAAMSIFYLIKSAQRFKFYSLRAQLKSLSINSRNMSWPQDHKDHLALQYWKEIADASE